MKTKAENTYRRKIGFRWYDETSNNSAKTDKIEENEQNNVVAVSMSSAQIDLVESIESLCEIITDESFAKYTTAQRRKFINQLVNFVALNIELTTKTNLLLLQKIKNLIEVKKKAIKEEGFTPFFFGLYWKKNFLQNSEKKLSKNLVV